MRKIKLLSFIITMMIGGLIGLQSSISNTARAETETVPIIIRDTVTNTIIDKRIVTKTDTLVSTRTKYVTIPVIDELKAAKAIRLIPLPMAKLPNPVTEEVETTVTFN